MNLPIFLSLNVLLYFGDYKYDNENLQDHFQDLIFKKLLKNDFFHIF